MSLHRILSSLLSRLKKTQARMKFQAKTRAFWQTLQIRTKPPHTPLTEEHSSNSEAMPPNRKKSPQELVHELRAVEASYTHRGLDRKELEKAFRDWKTANQFLRRNKGKNHRDEAYFRTELRRTKLYASYHRKIVNLKYKIAKKHRDQAPKKSCDVGIQASSVQIRQETDTHDEESSVASGLPRTSRFTSDSYRAKRWGPLHKW